MPDSSRYFTPPSLARMWGCSPETVLAYIRSGRLRAFSLSPHGSRRPRWRISPDDVRAFEDAQAPKPAKPRPKRPSRRSSADVIEFF